MENSNDWSEEELEADRQSFGHTRIVRLTRLLLLELVNMDADPSGFILIPGKRGPTFFWGNFSAGFTKTFSRDDRVSIACYLKEMANMSTRNENASPEVGYIFFEAGGRNLVYILQTRPTPVGEEMTVRLTTITDPTIDFSLKNKFYGDKD